MMKRKVKSLQLASASARYTSSTSSIWVMALLLCSLSSKKQSSRKASSLDLIQSGGSSHQKRCRSSALRQCDRQLSYWTRPYTASVSYSSAADKTAPVNATASRIRSGSYRPSYPSAITWQLRSAWITRIKPCSLLSLMHSLRSNPLAWTLSARSGPNSRQRTRRRCTGRWKGKDFHRAPMKSTGYISNVEWWWTITLFKLSDGVDRKVWPSKLQASSSASRSRIIRRRINTSWVIRGPSVSSHRSSRASSTTYRSRSPSWSWCRTLPTLKSLKHLQST